MIANTVVSDWVPLIIALGTAGASLIAAWRATQTHGEVKTLNAKTLGVLAGEQETRRIVDKPVSELTRDDQQHLLDVPPEPSPRAPVRPVDIRDQTLGG